MEAAFFSHIGLKVSNETMSHLIYEVKTQGLESF